MGKCQGTVWIQFVVDIGKLIIMETSFFYFLQKNVALIFSCFSFFFQIVALCPAASHLILPAIYFCSTFGCARGAKQDTVNTYLADACSNGAKIITGASVEKIFHQKVHSSEQAESHGRHRKTVGVIMCSGPSYCPLRIGIAAPVVVSCAGSLHTPALLLRSGITGGGHVGGNLRLHPCTCVVGVFPPDVHVQPYLGEGGAGVAGFSGANADGSIR